jgi:hypothetical protein
VGWGERRVEPLFFLKASCQDRWQELNVSSSLQRAACGPQEAPTPRSRTDDPSQQPRTYPSGVRAAAELRPANIRRVAARYDPLAPTASHPAGLRRRARAWCASPCRAPRSRWGRPPNPRPSRWSSRPEHPHRPVEPRPSGVVFHPPRTPHHERSRGSRQRSGALPHTGPHDSTAEEVSRDGFISMNPFLGVVSAGCRRSTPAVDRGQGRAFVPAASPWPPGFAGRMRGLVTSPGHGRSPGNRGRPAGLRQRGGSSGGSSRAQRLAPR